MRVRERIDLTGVPLESVVSTVLVRESLSTQFTIDVEVLCQDPDIDLQALIFQEGFVTLINRDHPSGGALRFFHGVVDRAEYVRKQATEHVYHLQLRPRMHGLSYRTCTRIFQDLSIIDIIPRVGWEVDVGFVNGDPDRPLVLQKMYNKETLPPYALPANKTQSALQSSTSPGGGGVWGTNIGAGVTESIGALAVISSAHDVTLGIGGSSKETVGAPRVELIKGAKAESCTNKIETVGTYAIKTKAGITINAKPAVALTVASEKQDMRGGHDVEAGRAAALTASTVTLEGSDHVTLTAGRPRSWSARAVLPSRRPLGSRSRAPRRSKSGRRWPWDVRRESGVV